MIPRTLRIVDLIAIVALAAGASLVARDTNPYTQHDFTFLACPLAVSATLALLLAATIGARFGVGSGRAFCWGFALVGWTYFAMGMEIGVSYPAQAMLPADLVGRAIGTIASRAGSAGYPRVASLAEYLCFLPRPGLYG